MVKEGVTETKYLAEGSVHDTGVVMDWAHSIGLYSNIQLTSDTVTQLEDNGGVYFVPGFHGLQAPVMDPTATAGFIGNMYYTKSNSYKLESQVQVHTQTYIP